jgi:hypothetical protein
MARKLADDLPLARNVTLTFGPMRLAWAKCSSSSRRSMVQFHKIVFLVRSYEFSERLSQYSPGPGRLSQRPRQDWG